jgi:hypothetical protein
MSTELSINVSRTYDCDDIIERIKQGELFRLTGAELIINMEFKEGETFTLQFGQRGSISGRIQRLTENEIHLSWNVKGFGREPELDTEVRITIHKNGKVRLNLDHLKITSAESAAAKKRAWEEILCNLDTDPVRD